jgi:hypothetical protein
LLQPEQHLVEATKEKTAQNGLHDEQIDLTQNLQQPIQENTATHSHSSDGGDKLVTKKNSHQSIKTQR